MSSLLTLSLLNKSQLLLLSDRVGIPKVLQASQLVRLWNKLTVCLLFNLSLYSDFWFLRASSKNHWPHANVEACLQTQTEENHDFSPEFQCEWTRGRTVDHVSRSGKSAVAPTLPCKPIICLWVFLEKKPSCVWVYLHFSLKVTGEAASVSSFPFWWIIDSALKKQ